MGRGTFRSQNKVGETFSFQTDSSSGTTFDPTVTFLSGSDRVSWDLGVGGGYIADNSLSYSYTDTGTTKTVTLLTNKLSRLSGFNIYTDNLLGNLDISGWDNLGGIFNVSRNSDLTGITHTTSTQLFTGYAAYECGLIGNHDVSMFPNLGGQFLMYLNPLLTGITHTASTQVFSKYWVYFCGLIGNHDLSMLTDLGGSIGLFNNPLLTSVTHPVSTQVFTEYDISSCNLGYVDFNPLSGATFNTVIGIKLQSNGMSATEVNHILVDLSVITVGNVGWTGTTINMSGTNAAPDSSSGGFDGVAAINTLTGATNNWTVITS